MMTMMQDRWSPERGGEDAISWSERMSNGVASNCEGSTGEATRSDDGGSNQETGPVDESRGQECESQSEAERRIRREKRKKANLNERRRSEGINKCISELTERLRGQCPNLDVSKLSKKAVLEEVIKVHDGLEVFKHTSPEARDLAQEISQKSKVTGVPVSDLVVVCRSAINGISLPNEYSPHVLPIMGPVVAPISSSGQVGGRFMPPCITPRSSVTPLVLYNHYTPHISTYYPSLVPTPLTDTPLTMAPVPTPQSRGKRSMSDTPDCDSCSPPSKLSRRESSEDNVMRTPSRPISDRPARHSLDVLANAAAAADSSMYQETDEGSTDSA